MKTARNIAIWIFVCLGIATAFAQSVTTKFSFTVPVTCGVISMNYTETCPGVQLNSEDGGVVLVRYQPVFNGRMSTILFGAGSGVLSNLGYGQINSLTTTLLSHTDNGLKRGNTLLQGYEGTDTWRQQAKFVNQSTNPLVFIGSTDTTFVTTTRCCSSGRDAGPHTTGGMTFATGEVTK